MCVCGIFVVQVLNTSSVNNSVVYQSDVYVEELFSGGNIGGGTLLWSLLQLHTALYRNSPEINSNTQRCTETAQRLTATHSAVQKQPID